MSTHRYPRAVPAGFDKWAKETLHPDTYAAMQAKYWWFVLVLESYGNRNLPQVNEPSKTRSLIRTPRGGYRTLQHERKAA